MNKAPTVLCVDDSADFRELVSLMLTKSGLIVEAFEDAGQALDWLVINQPAMIISDLNMTPMNGLEFMAAVRSTQNLAATPFVLFSSDPSVSTLVISQPAALVDKMRPSALRTAVFSLLGSDGRYFAARAAVGGVRAEIDRARLKEGKAPLSDEGWDQIARELAAHQRADALGDTVAVLARVNGILEGQP